MITRIMLVEDDPWFGALLKRHLSLNPDYEVHLFTSGKDCLRNLHIRPDIVTIDFGLPDMQGDQLFQELLAYNKNLPVIVISGQEKISVAINFLKAGARDYIVKDENTKDLLWNSILRVKETLTLKKEVETLKEQLEEKHSFGNSIIGNSPAIRQTFALLEKAARSNINVSISGETGTGKEVFAKAIHYNSDRKKAQFVAVNMAAIPSELMESELFGHEKGAFTGASQRKAGRFEEANGGTLFLDEIGELDLALQSKILRALQEREITRVGGNDRIKLNIRLITATHKDLAGEVQAGRFREDLYFRIIGLPLHLPPLRERGNDILLLAKHFAEQAAKENKIRGRAFSPAAKQKLLQYSYPGNVRELKAVVELAVVMSEGTEIGDTDLIFSNLRGSAQFIPSGKTLRQYTADIISHYLNKNDYSVIEVAKLLDIGKSTIYGMIKNKEIQAPQD